MLKHLSVQNYALIDKLEVEFTEGLTIITGETGAGKSILLGALGLIAGSRGNGNGCSYPCMVLKCIGVLSLISF